MQRKISLLLLTGGFFFISLAGYEFFKTTSGQNKALESAQKLVRLEEAPLMNDASLSVTNDKVMGILSIPTLKEELPIIRGVSEEDLEKGVGYYEGTALPNEGDQIVLSGHRDTVFKRLGELELGDELVVEMPNGTFTYVIEETFVVEADDRTVIRSTAPIEKLTLTTCYPFHFIGDAPQRYIINAIRK
jgi:sortase A